MDLLTKMFEMYKDQWFYRKIIGYKSKVYYRFHHIPHYRTEIIMTRYYPKTEKWEHAVCSTLEYMGKLFIEEDKEILANLDAKFAILLLTEKDK